MLKTLFLHPLGPALILAVGGLLLQIGAWQANGRSIPALARWRASGAAGGMGARTLELLTGQRILRSLGLLGAALALLDLLALRRLPLEGAAPRAAGELRWAWQPLTVAGSELIWQMNGWSWLVAALILLLTAAALLLQDARRGPGGRSQASRTLWLGAAALAFVFSANVVTLASCWVLLDAALVLRLRPGEGERMAGRAWSLLSLAGLVILAVLLLLGENGIRAPLARGPFDSTELALLWLAALLRAGVYPFHLWLTARGPLDASDRIALHLIAPLTGLWLLACVHEVAGPGWLRRPEWAALGALALLGSALAAWTAADRELAWRWVAINRASLVVMAAYMADLAGPPALAWAIVTFCLGLALLLAGQMARQRLGWRWPSVLGALALWGLPGTPGFLARSALVLPVRISGALLIFGIMVVAEVLLVATLWQIVAGEQAIAAPAPPARRRFRPAYIALGALVVLLAVPTLAWGVTPRQLGFLLGPPLSGMGNQTLLQIIGEARRSVWGVLILSGLAGMGLGMVRERVFAGMRGWQGGIMALVSLDWLYGLIGFGFAVIGSGLRYFATLGEGEGYVGWLVLAGLVLWVLLRG